MAALEKTRERGEQSQGFGGLGRGVIGGGYRWPGYAGLRGHCTGFGFYFAEMGNHWRVLSMSDMT